MKSKTFVEIVTAFLVILFTYTAVGKILNIDNFRLTIKLVPVVGHFAYPLSMIVPFAEAITVICLLKYRQLGLYLSAVLMAAFTLYVVYVIYFSMHIPCSCGGIIRQLTWKQHLLFNSLTTIIAIFAGWLNKITKPVQPITYAS